MGSALCVGALALPASAGDLTSASFQLRGSHFGALGDAGLASAGPRFSGSGVAMGQGGALGWAGGAGTQATSAPGFWPIVAGAVPDLDPDGDGLPSWLDTDDDDDGLPDAVETNTGVFVSSADTGTDPLNPDSDGDGFPDGLEVEQGSNPNDAGSTPGPGVPALPVWGAAGLACALLAGARRRIGSHRARGWRRMG